MTPAQREARASNMRAWHAKNRENPSPEYLAWKLSTKRAAWRQSPEGRENIRRAGEAFRASRKGRAHQHAAVMLMQTPEIATRRSISLYERHERLAVERGDATKSAKWGKKVRTLKAELKALAS